MNWLRKWLWHRRWLRGVLEAAKFEDTVTEILLGLPTWEWSMVDLFGGDGSAMTLSMARRMKRSTIYELDKDKYRRLLLNGSDIKNAEFRNGDSFKDAILSGEGQYYAWFNKRVEFYGVNHLSLDKAVERYRSEFAEIGIKASLLRKQHRLGGLWYALFKLEAV